MDSSRLLGDIRNALQDLGAVAIIKDVNVIGLREVCFEKS